MTDGLVIRRLFNAAVISVIFRNVPSLFQLIFVRREDVSESRFHREIHGGGVRPICPLSLSAATILSYH